MFYIIGKPKDVSRLDLPHLKLNNIQRKDVPIAIIDDQGFDYLERLKLHKFNISYFNDVTNLESLLAYEIILCDIRGVGQSFASKFDGAHVMREIHNIYPFKTLIAYTAYTYDPTYNTYLNVTDIVLKKDIDLDEWVENLDRAIKITTDPKKRWLKLRNYFLARDVSLVNLAKLEDEYVKIILNKGDFSHFPSDQAARGLPQDIRAILQSFAGSLLLKLIAG